MAAAGKLILRSGWERPIIGEDPLNNERLWRKTYVPKFMGQKGNSLWTVSAIDIALWDIKAKVAGLPLYRLMGGAREKVPVYIAGGYYAPDKGFKELQQEMEANPAGGPGSQDEGGSPVHEGGCPEVKAVREAIGDDVSDAGCQLFLRYLEAIQFARRVEEYHPYCFEEPVAQDDYDGYRKIFEKCGIPLAAGENEMTRFGFRDLIRSQSVSILNPDATCMGGVTEFLKVAGMANANGLVLSPHGQQQVHIHLDCAVPNATIAEFYPPQYDEKIYEAFQAPVRFNEDGTVSPSQAPGVGLDINREVLKDFRVG